MSTRPSVVFLYDLDLIYGDHRSLNGVEKRDSTQLNSTEHSFTSVLRLISISILNHLTPKQANVQWAYRFYTSSFYKHTHKAGFQDLSEHSLEEFEENLNVCYEQHTSIGTTSSSGMSKAGVLGRTLQDIATDFSWKTPTDSLTPTRKGRRNAKQLVEQSLHNLVFIFTDVPTDDSISLFCNLNSNPSNLSSKAVMDCILTKDLLKKFNEFQLSLNFVDLSTDSKKSFISKIASDLRGAVINSAALASYFSFSQIFQAARTVEQVQPSKDICSSCQELQLRPKFSMHLGNLTVEVDVQCWNTTCSGSSLKYDDVHVPMLTCAPVFQGAIPNASLLCYDALYLLSANGNCLEQQANERFIWVGQWNEHIFVILPLNSSVASMIFPSSNWNLTFMQRILDNAIDSKSSSDNQCPDIQRFVEKLVASTGVSESACVASVEPSTDEIVPQPHTWGRLHQLKSNYVDRKISHFGTHWEQLKDCFQLGVRHKEEPDILRSSMDNCTIERPKSSDTFPAISTDAIKMKIGNSRIQNLRASQLLQKSQEVRARKDEIEREKLNKEKQAADEKRERKWKEVETYIVSLRRSVSTEDFVRTVMDEQKPFDKIQALERLLQVKKEMYESPVEEWQLFCLAQVIATTLLYIWRDPDAQNFELGYDTLSTHFLKTPASISRTVSKENKIHEYKFQILLRLELCWMVPSLANEEEILQETATLLQLLSISCPKAMSIFFQDTLVIHFENMLPDLLVSLAEEMNQTIPTSLSELISNLNARGTPSPATSSGLPSVQSTNSHQDVGGSQRPATRELRSRTLSRQPSINILQHKKQIALPNKSDKPSAATATTAANGSSLPKKEESSEVGRVRRSLQFGMDTPVKGGKSRSPNKMATPKRNNSLLGVSTLSFPEFTTPSKTTDLILAPETPSRLRSGGKNIRKTDGIHVVVESPEVKQEAVRSSPRRLQAAMALRRRASFYSSLNSVDATTTGSSRHWSRAESQVWSEKAKANAAILTEDGSSSKPGHSAQFLFSRILSRNESDSNQTETLVLSTPLKDIPELAELASSSGWNPPVTGPPGVKVAIDPLRTPLKSSHSNSETHTEVIDANLLAPPVADFPLFAVPNGGATPTKTPMKTPKHVQFDLSFQPATPSSKTVPCASILKSPMPVAPSPFRNKTPLKVSGSFEPASQAEKKSGLHVLDETSFDDAQELDLLSPAKGGQQEKASCTPPDRQDDVVRKLDERTLLPEDEVQLQSPVKPSAKSTVSPLILRRSSRSMVNGGNMMRSDPNWTVVDYKRLISTDGSKSKSIGRRCRTQAMKKSNEDEQIDDPYEFNEEENSSALCQRSYGHDTSSHKRKLFQSGCDKMPSNKKRKVLQQSPPVAEKPATSSPSAPSLRKFQPPLNSSLFHLENSPLLNSLDTKINV